MRPGNPSTKQLADGAEARIDYDNSSKTRIHTLYPGLNERGGDNFGYRLSVRPLQPDFSVNFSRHSAHQSWRHAGAD